MYQAIFISLDPERERVMGTAQQRAAISLRQQTVAPSVALFKRHLYFRFKERSFPLWQEILDSLTHPNRKSMRRKKKQKKTSSLEFQQGG